jgi:hypothetical protein
MEFVHVFVYMCVCAHVYQYVNYKEVCVFHIINSIVFF